jgi:hypothetical protein
MPRESRRGATRLNEVASLMSHVSLAVHSRERAGPAEATETKWQDGWTTQRPRRNRKSACHIPHLQEAAPMIREPHPLPLPGVPRGPPRRGDGRVRKPFPMRFESPSYPVSMATNASVAPHFVPLASDNCMTAPIFGGGVERDPETSLCSWPRYVVFVCFLGPRGVLSSSLQEGNIVEFLLGPVLPGTL